MGTEVSIKIFSVFPNSPQITPNFALAKFARRADQLNPFGFNCDRRGNPDRLSIAKFGITAVFTEAFDEIKRVEDMASFFSPSSELFYLNSKAPYEPVKVSDELFCLVEKGLWMSRISDGAFDVTATSLGVRDGYKTIKLDGAKKEIYFTDKNCKIDMGAYAKGYAVDKALEVLKKYSIKRAVVDAGGNIKFLGLPPNKKEWSVGIRSPENPAEIFRTVKVKPRAGKEETGGGIQEEAALATSGNYLRKHIVALKKRDESVLSVTIIAPTALEADLLSTTIFNMADVGERLKVLENFDDIEVWIVRRDDNGGLKMAIE